jgi:hypothetical protein
MSRTLRMPLALFVLLSLAWSSGVGSAADQKVITPPFGLVWGQAADSPMPGLAEHGLKLKVSDRLRDSWDAGAGPGRLDQRWRRGSITEPQFCGQGCLSATCAFLEHAGLGAVAIWGRHEAAIADPWIVNIIRVMTSTYGPPRRNDFAAGRAKDHGSGAPMRIAAWADQADSTRVYLIEMSRYGPGLAPGKALVTVTVEFYLRSHCAELPSLEVAADPYR